MTRGATLLVGLALMATGPARAERLVLSLSNHQVQISSTYTGTELTGFGVIERDAQTASRAGGFDVVITVRGPREAATVRRKEEFGPIWLNRGQQKFVAAPAFIGVLSSHPLSEIVDDTARRRLRLGLAAIVNAPEFTLDRGPEDEPYRAALVRLKSRDGLYVEDERGVGFVTDGFFRATIPLPATAPTGNYDVEAALFAGGALLARSQSSFELVKTGFEDRVTSAARERPLVYGIGTALISLAFGWVASVIFRRD